MDKLSIRTIRNFSRVKVIPDNFCNISKEEQKAILLPRLKYVDWFKSTDRLEYNTWLFYKNLGCNVSLQSYNMNNYKKYCIIIDDIDIHIRIQDYFFIKLMNRFKKKKLIRDWFEDNYLDDTKVLVEYPICTHKYDKAYRVDYLFHVSGDNYICVEFFENAHKKKDDPDCKLEKNRIYSILHNSDNRYKKVILFRIYWENKLEDKLYFKNFVKDLYGDILKYKDIDDKRIWCINGLNKYIKNDIISESIYDSHINKDNAVISIDEINKVIHFKGSCKDTHLYEFKVKIDQLVKENNKSTIDDDLLDDIYDSDPESELATVAEPCSVKQYYKDNKLTFQGLIWYLKIKDEHLIDILEVNKINNLFINITKGFIEGLEEQRDMLIYLEDHKIIGLDDFVN